MILMNIHFHITSFRYLHIIIILGTEDQQKKTFNMVIWNKSVMMREVKKLKKIYFLLTQKKNMGRWMCQRMFVNFTRGQIFMYI
jgi:hypothetical protein